MASSRVGVVVVVLSSPSSSLELVNLTILLVHTFLLVLIVLDIVHYAAQCLGVVEVTH